MAVKNDFVLMTDICCDLPAKLADELGLVSVPLSFTIDGKEYHNYLDEREISFKDFYELLRSSGNCSTSAVNVSSFISYMEPVLAAGNDLLYIAFSSALSNTCNAALIAAQELRLKYTNRRIFVVDSLSASMGQGLLVYLSALQRLNGSSLEQVMTFAEDTRLKVCHWFTVEDLFHLHKGGRVSRSSAVFGSMLNIKPILHVDNEGRLIPVSKVRGAKAAIRTLFDNMKLSASYSDPQTVMISHGDALDKVQILTALINEEFPNCNIITNFIGPTIGAHTGSGTLSLFFIGSKR